MGWFGWFKRNTLSPEQKIFQTRVHEVADALVLAMEKRSDTGRPLYSSPLITYKIADEFQHVPEFVTMPVFADEVRREFRALNQGQFELHEVHLDSLGSPTLLQASLSPAEEGSIRQRVEKQAVQSREAHLVKALRCAERVIQRQLVHPIDEPIPTFDFGRLRPAEDGGLSLSFPGGHHERIQRADLPSLQDRIERSARRNFGVVITGWETHEKFGAQTLRAKYRPDV